MATVHLHRFLASLFQGVPNKVTVEAATVGELVRELDRRWPGMWDRLCEAGPTIRVHMNIFVDGDRSTLATQLAPDSVVYIIPAVSGG